MFCPSCGNQGTNDQKFCRSCGMNLQRVAPALIEHLAETGSAQTQIEPPAVFQQRALRKMLLGMTIIFIGAAIGIIGKMMIYNEQVTGVGAIVAILGMFWLAYSALSTSLKLSPAGHRLPQTAMEPDAKTTSQLPQERVANFIPGITEHTTDLLAEAATEPVERKRS